MNLKVKIIRTVQIWTLFQILALLIGLFVISCSSSDSSSGAAKPGSVVTPSLEVEQYGDGGGKGPRVELPLRLWPDFEYRRLVRQGKGKVEHCFIKEANGTPIAVGTQVTFIEDASCFYSYIEMENGGPRNYHVGLMKIKINETGEIGWIWCNAVELNN